MIRNNPAAISITGIGFTIPRVCNLLVAEMLQPMIKHKYIQDYNLTQYYEGQSTYKPTQKVTAPSSHIQLTRPIPLQSTTARQQDREG